MESKDLFIAFALENLVAIPHPSQNKSFEVKGIHELVDLLYIFLSHDVEIQDLSRLSENFTVNFQKIYDFRLSEVPIAIEGLATNFESFLKKIAYLRFKGTSFWHGDEAYLGINKTTLADILRNQVPVRHETNDGKSNVKKYSEPIISLSGTSGAILEFVRENLRNGVHYAKKYSRVELTKFSNLVTGAYLIALDFNREFLKKNLFIEFSYLEAIQKDREFISVNKIYVELYGKEETILIDNMAVEVLDGQKLVASLNSINEEDDDEGDNSIIPRIDTISNITSDTDRFVLIGEPGSGKTTTLQKILFENAKGILSGNSNLRYPVYIAASSFSNTFTFKRLITLKLGVDTLDELRIKYKFVLLIDGFNEIESEFKRAAIKEINELLLENDDLAIVISTRKTGFNNYWGVPVFELKDLNNRQGKQLIDNVIGKDEGDVLWHQIQSSKHLEGLIHNPLMLMMIIKVSRFYHGVLPSNKGLLFKLFNDAILERERKIYDTNIETKNEVLSHIAYWMRSNGLFKKINKYKAKELIAEKLKIANPGLGVNDVFNELADNNFFGIIDNDLVFYHETQQEYFVALEIRSRFYRSPDIDIGGYDEGWIEALIICSDLLNSAEDRMSFFELLFIGVKTGTPKNIHSITEADINNKFPLACRIAFNLKQIHPNIFHVAEKYLSNYLTVWSLLQSEGKILLDFKVLIDAAAHLSSPKIFHKLFFNIKYAIDFFGGTFDKKHFLDDVSVDENIKIFRENLTDFSAFYYLTLDRDNISNSFWTALGLTNYFKQFRDYLLQNTSNAKLIPIFLQARDSVLLKHIGKTDLEFFIANYHHVSNGNPQKLYDFIIRRHSNNRLGQEFLLKSLADSNTAFSIKLTIIKKMVTMPALVEQLLETVKKMLVSADAYEHSEVLEEYTEFRRTLARFPLNLLQEYKLDRLYVSPQIAMRDLHFETVNSDKIYTQILVSNAISPILMLKKHMGNILINNVHTSVKFIENHKYSNKHYVVVVSGEREEIEDCCVRYRKGGTMTVYILQNRIEKRIIEFKFHTVFKTQKDNKCLISVSQVDQTKISNFKDFRKMKGLVDYKFHFNIEGVSMHMDGHSLLEVPYWGETAIESVKILEVLIDSISLNNYHPDSLKENPVVLRYLANQAEAPEYQELIADLELASAPNTREKPILYLILKKQEATKNNRYVLLEMYSGKIIDFISYYVDLEKNLTKNNVVSISSYNWLYVVPFVAKEGVLLESKIIAIDGEKKEGFIKAVPQDYYFSFEYCNFIPRLGNVVTFVPGNNFYKNYTSKPAAYLITLKKNADEAVIHSVTESKSAFEIYLFDEEKNEKLFCRVNKLPSIEGFSQHLTVHSKFTYVQHPIQKIGGLRRVNLVEVISN